MMIGISKIHQSSFWSFSRMPEISAIMCHVDAFFPATFLELMFDIFSKIIVAFQRLQHFRLNTGQGVTYTQIKELKWLHNVGCHSFPSEYIWTTYSGMPYHGICMRYIRSFGWICLELFGYSLHSCGSIWPRGIETVETLEITGLQCLPLGRVGITTAGSFECLSKLAKDAGRVEVLRNTSTMFPPEYHYPEPSYIASTTESTTVPYVTPVGFTPNTPMDKFVNS